LFEFFNVKSRGRLGKVFDIHDLSQPYSFYKQYGGGLTEKPIRTRAGSPFEYQTRLSEQATAKFSAQFAPEHAGRGKDYPDILAIVSKNLIELINTNKITRAISEAFNTLKNYSKLEKEENLLNFFKDKIKYTILKILQEGVISKSELITTLRRDHGFSTINIDLLLISFLRENLIIKDSVPGSKDCYFLVKDLAYTRIPPKDFLSKSQFEDEITEDYQEKLINFYKSYDCASEIENKTIINFLIDKDSYQLLLKLRENSLSVVQCLDILNNKEDLFNELLEKKIIYETQGNVFLFSDIRFIKFTPFYLIERLSKRYKDREISFNEYITHLKLLTERYNKHQSLIDYNII